MADVLGDDTLFEGFCLTFYNTGIWLGALINAMLLSWMMVSSMGMADAYYVQNIIDIIFGV